jgi:hypothetical protein
MLEENSIEWNRHFGDRWHPHASDFHVQISEFYQFNPTALLSLKDDMIWHYKDETMLKQ